MYTDHKSLEGWYKEDLCTLSEPLGRRGQWHEFLSRYHIEVVYKPGKDNTFAAGLSRWADGTNFHGSDADQKGVMKQEPGLREREENVLAQRARDTQVQSDLGVLTAITAVCGASMCPWDMRGGGGVEPIEVLPSSPECLPSRYNALRRGKPVRTPVAIFGSLGVCIYLPASRHSLISYPPIHLT